MKTYQLHPYGDRAFLIRFKQEISPEVNRLVSSCWHTLERAKPRGIVNLVPAYASLLVEYDPSLVHAEKLCKKLRNVLDALPEDIPSDNHAAETVIEIPVHYGGEDGPDLTRVAAHAHLTEEEVIRRHSEAEYLVYMIGFRPGFAYLGGLDPALETPRLSTPREKIPAGSVGIAGLQTGAYPEASPGGWNLIGRTNFEFYSESKGSTLRPGGRIRFVPVDFLPTPSIARIAPETPPTGHDATSNELNSLSLDPAIEVLNKGLLTLPVSLKRHFQEKDGVPTGGPMDRESAALANRVLGNDIEAFCLEASYLLPSLRFLKPTRIALASDYGDSKNTGSEALTSSGYSLQPRSEASSSSSYYLQRGNQKIPLALNQPIDVLPQDVLLSVPITLGCRVYIAFDNGLSISSLRPAPLSKGDMLALETAKNKKTHLMGLFNKEDGKTHLMGLFNKEDGKTRSLGLFNKKNTMSLPNASSQINGVELTAFQGYHGASLGNDVTTIQVYRGVDADRFSDAALQQFLSQEYTYSVQSDRMGIRLSGEPVPSEQGGTIISEPMMPGDIQMPPGGLPIIMMADCQPTGGYAKIAHVKTADLSKLAQLRPGAKIIFTLIQ